MCLRTIFEIDVFIFNYYKTTRKRVLSASVLKRNVRTKKKEKKKKELD